MTLLKAAVLALILANVGYFLWARDLAASDSLVVAAGAPTAPSIKLASEVPQIAAARVPSVQALREDSADRTPVAGSAPGGAAGAAAGEVSAQLLTNVKRCISIGPFRDVSEAARAATTLRASGYGPRQRVAEGEVWAGVWIYLPRPADLEADEQLLAKLKKAGIDDAMEMPGPNDASVVSLGLFSEPKRAQARLAQAQRLGLNPLVTDRKRSGNVFWVDMDLKSSDGLLNPTDLRGEAGRIVRLEVKACPPPSAP
jgi:hypothetical protein